MIIITGAAGFIGSSLISKLNQEGYYDLVLVDDFSSPLKNRNFEGKRYSQCIDRRYFIKWLRDNHLLVQFVFHLGARSELKCKDIPKLEMLNVEFSKDVWRYCIEFGLPLLYASSPKSESQQKFNNWVSQQKQQPYFWAGLQFSDIYGPNEYHKSEDASILTDMYRIINTGEKVPVTLFAHKYPPRNWLYVKDVMNVLFFFMLNRKNSGQYRIGNGPLISVHELAAELCKAMHREPKRVLELPEQAPYNFGTESTFSPEQVRAIGYEANFYSLQEGLEDCVRNYLLFGRAL